MKSNPLSPAGSNPNTLPANDAGGAAEIEETPEVIVYTENAPIPPPFVETNAPKYTTNMTTEEHIAAAAQHVKCELWQFFLNVVDTTPGWRRSKCHPYLAVAERASDVPDEHDSKSYDVKVSVLKDLRKGSMNVDLSAMKGNLVIWRDNLFYTYAVGLTCGCSASAFTRYKCPRRHKKSVAILKMRKLRCMLPEYPDEEAGRDPQYPSMFYSFGFCGDLSKAWYVLDNHNFENITMLEAIMNPAASRDRAAGYRTLAAAIGPPLVASQGGRMAEAATDRAAAEAIVPSTYLNIQRDTALVKSQRAVLNALRAPLELIHGPPGTGKSTIIRSIVRERFPFENQELILICSVQNRAVDVLVKMFRPFVDFELSVSQVGMLVIGSPLNNNMGADAAQFTLEGIIGQNPAVESALSAYEAGQLGSKVNRAALFKSLEIARETAENTALASARIVFSTITEVHKLLTSPKLKSLRDRFTSVVVDEAATVPEWQMVLLATLPSIKRIVCVGDTKQLPPFTTIKNAPRGFLERAERQFRLSHIDVPMLTVQFRMDRAIGELVSTSYYDGVVVSGTNIAARVPEFSPGGLRLKGIYWLDYRGRQPTHVIRGGGGGGGGDVFYSDTLLTCDRRLSGDPDAALNGFEEPIFKSFANSAELGHLLEGLSLFLHAGLLEGPKAKTVAVLSFYRQQVDLLESALLDERCRDRDRFASALASGALRLQTVDSAQGSEADVVLLSCVRSNAEAGAGFLAGAAGKQRMCVALSRAREALIVVADPRTVAQAIPRPPEMHQESPSMLPIGLAKLWPNGPDEMHDLNACTRLEAFGELAASGSARAAYSAAQQDVSDLFVASTPLRRDLFPAQVLTRGPGYGGASATTSTADISADTVSSREHCKHPAGRSGGAGTYAGGGGRGGDVGGRRLGSPDGVDTDGGGGGSGTGGGSYKCFTAICKFEDDDFM
jgi:hypothetical protein